MTSIKNKQQVITQLAILSGILIPALLQSKGILVGKPGLAYYAEVHTMPLNSYMHTIFMPFSMYGILLWLPQIFRLNNENSIYLQKFFYLMYMTHYISIDFTTGLCVALYYYPVVSTANSAYKENIQNPFIKGIIISFLSLGIQEVFGHYLSGDPPSRGEAVPNAIMYAMY